MEDRQHLKEHCGALHEADLVRLLTVDRADHSPAMVAEAQLELERRSLTLDGVLDRVTVQLGDDAASPASVADAVAVVDAGLPRRAVALFTHCLGESLLYQREAWGWVVHHYQDDRYGLSYLVDEPDRARRLLERFLRLQPWRDDAGAGHHLDEWETLAASEDGDAVLALADRLQAGDVPHVVRSPLFTPEGDDTVALLVPPDRRAEAVEVAGTGRAPVQALRRRARELDAAGDRHAELAAYDELVEADPDSHAAHYNRGAVLLELARPEEAAAAFMRCAEAGLSRLQPQLDSGSVRGGVFGIAARLVGRVAGTPVRQRGPDWLEDVRLQLEALLQQLGARTDLLHSLASVARIQGDTDAAAARYRQILELSPDDEVARFQLGYLRAAAD